MAGGPRPAQPWRPIFRQGTAQLWSVDVGSSNWEEINYRLAGPTTGLINRGWPCYEGTPGVAAQRRWDALDKPICESCTPRAPARSGAVLQLPDPDRRDPADPRRELPGRLVLDVRSRLHPASSDWPTAYRGSLFFSDFLRGCIWRLEKRTDGDPDPGSVRSSRSRAGSPVHLITGPGGDLYYVDYGLVHGDVVPGAGGVHRIRYTGLSVRSL